MNLRRAIGCLRTPAWALSLVAWLTSMLVQTGAFGTVDTTRRYQVTRALWRAEPPVPPGDFPGYGLMAHDGQVHAWYGLGQSLVMLPADIAARAATGVLGLDGPLRMKIETGLVAFGTFPLIAALNAVFGYALLRALGGFTVRVSVLGVLAWLFATTVLPYSQLHYENSLDLCLSLAIALAVYRFAKSGDRKLLFAAGLATGLMVLTRVSNVVDAVVLTGAAVLAAYNSVSNDRRGWLRARIRDLALVYLPCLALSLLADRAYQVARFGWGQALSTYIHLFGVQRRAMHPELPPDYPFSGAFLDGFFGPLLSPNRSLFLFDPLLLAGVALFVWAVATRRLSKGLAVMLGAFGVITLARLLAYAKYAHWSGGTSWSSRFTLTPVQLALLFVVPLFLVLKQHLNRALRGLFVALIALAATLQLCAVIGNPDLENIQASCDRAELPVLPERVVNVARELLEVDPDGLSRHGCVPEEFRRVNVLPWGNARDLPERARTGALVAWCLLLCLWLAALFNVLGSAGAATTASGARG